MQFTTAWIYVELIVTASHQRKAQTGEEIIKAKKVAKFLPGKALKHAVS